MTLPDPTPELERFIARHLSGMSTDEWRALSNEERRPHIQKARHVLKLERNFLTRGSAESSEETA